MADNRDKNKGRQRPGRKQGILSSAMSGTSQSSDQGTTQASRVAAGIAHVLAMFQFNPGGAKVAVSSSYSCNSQNESLATVEPETSTSARGIVAESRSGRSKGNGGQSGKVRESTSEGLLMAGARQCAGGGTAVSPIKEEGRDSSDMAVRRFSAHSECEDAKASELGQGAKWMQQRQQTRAPVSGEEVVNGVSSGGSMGPPPVTITPTPKSVVTDDLCVEDLGDDAMRVFAV